MLRHFTKLKTRLDTLTMSTLLPLLTAAAVPFTLGGTGVAARRRRRPAGHHGRAVDDYPSLHDILNRSPHPALAAAVVDEAGRALQYGLGPRTTSERATNTEPTPTAPPNSPAAQTSGRFTFDVPDDEDAPAPIPTRKRRKRPSFRLTHRVEPKTWCSSDHADDEDSSEPPEDLLEDSDQEAREELRLRLRILAETQRAVREDSTEEEDSKPDTDWSKVGEELRHIADRFQEAAHADAGETSTARRERLPVDVLGLINMMLPFSIPQSLWSAIVSYAAWKFFKKFQ